MIIILNIKFLSPGNSYIYPGRGGGGGEPGKVSKLFSSNFVFELLQIAQDDHTNDSHMLYMDEM